MTLCDLGWLLLAVTVIVNIVGCIVHRLRQSHHHPAVSLNASMGVAQEKENTGRMKDVK
jgi:hypothetical protein